MDYSSFTVHFDGSLSPKVIVKFTTIRLNFSIFPTPCLCQGKGLLLSLVYEVKNDRGIVEKRFYLYTWSYIDIVVLTERCDSQPSRLDLYWIWRESTFITLKIYFYNGSTADWMKDCFFYQSLNWVFILHDYWKKSQSPRWHLKNAFCLKKV